LATGFMLVQPGGTGKRHIFVTVSQLSPNSRIHDTDIKENWNFQKKV
jgi:hypothetical protein